MTVHLCVFVFYAVHEYAVFQKVHNSVYICQCEKQYSAPLVMWFKYKYMFIEIIFTENT